MNECDLKCMQRLAFKSKTTQLVNPAAIDGVTDNGMPYGGHVDPQLVGSSGFG